MLQRTRTCSNCICCCFASFCSDAFWAFTHIHAHSRTFTIPSRFCLGLKKLLVANITAISGTFSTVQTLWKIVTFTHIHDSFTICFWHMMLHFFVVLSVPVVISAIWDTFSVRVLHVQAFSTHVRHFSNVIAILYTCSMFRILCTRFSVVVVDIPAISDAFSVLVPMLLQFPRRPSKGINRFE